MSATGPRAWLRGTPAVSITGAHLTLRRWRPDDVDELTTAIAASIDHLVPWMPWAADHDRDAAARFITQSDTAWQAATDFHYAVGDATGRLLGGAGLHARLDAGGLEIGYWVSSDATRRRVATRAAALLTAEGLSIDGVTHVEIHHDRANEISGRVPRRLGFAHAGTAPGDRSAPAHSGVDVRWRLTRDAYMGSMARTLVAGHADIQP